MNEEERRVEESNRNLSRSADAGRSRADLDPPPPSDSGRSRPPDDEPESRDVTSRRSTFAQVAAVIDYVFYVIYGLLGLRFLLALIAARPDAGFVQLVHALTDWLYFPFRDIVPSPVFEGGYTLEISIVIAVLVYALVHAAVIGLLRLMAVRGYE